jgi:hypothetical protein
MIDVHPAPHAAHSLKEFFIHIATIVVGLLIALSLEQIIELIHHRHQIEELRSSLSSERDHNRAVYHRATEVYMEDSAILHNNLRVFNYLRDHPGTPEAKLPGVVIWPSHTFEPSMSAWNDTGQSSVLAMMPREEVNKYSSTYFNLQRTLDGYNASIVAIANAAAINSQTSDPAALPPDSVKQEIDLIARAAALHTLYGLWLARINRNQPDFLPYLSDEEVLVFADLPGLEKLRANYPEAAAFTQRDIDTARRLYSGSSSSNAESK